MPSWPLASAALLGAALFAVAAPPSPPASGRARAKGSPAASRAPAKPSPSPSPEAPPPSPSPTPLDGPIILFLVDNSASLPPLDPEEKRVAALEKMFTFLQGRPYRLILFGGRREVFVDDVSRYRNNGQWTDYYAAFDKARQLMATYPKATEFRMILV